MNCLRRRCKGVLVRHSPKRLPCIGEMSYRCSFCGRRFTELQVAMARRREEDVQGEGGVDEELHLPTV